MDTTFADQVERFFDGQMEEFHLARANYETLRQAEYRTLRFGRYSFVLQYNPGRIRSTNANIDPKALQARKCFLCPENLPPFQRALPWGDKYKIFVNPYPIFARHFTVPSVTHRPQLLEGGLADMLALAQACPAYTVFYNGPRSGASAPDHFHFQMAPRHVMPLEADVQFQRVVEEGKNYTIGTLDEYIRQVILLQSSDNQRLTEIFEKLMNYLGGHIPSDPEPMINLLAWCEEGEWTVAVFPRRELRPRQFYAEGDEKILFSPGSVDFAGLLVTPRREDYDRLTIPLLTDLFGQLTPNS